MAQRGKNNLKKDFQEASTRPARLRRYDQFFLVVCEDENTEPAYFQQFIDLLPDLPEPTLYLECVGAGLDPLGVVQRAVHERDELAKAAEKEVDFVWTVFDKDDADENEAKVERFNQAFALAQKEKINIAFSNEVFEVWLLLHLTDLSMEEPIPRIEIYNMLQDKVRELEKSEDFVYIHGSGSIVEKVNTLGDETMAIERAKALETHFSETQMLAANPSTRVYYLVDLLRGWVRYYNREE